ncbi:CCA tRNA nucleotidyltransferase [Fervidicoccus fontis]|uniref:CCA-adding enzyme n=2 Tax=Fervidicoccus fontis TaxID=683846 RepID=I0A2C8_FERFK|nr:CCA tRNA nucleotidyltransferase [Fervidicoccus fontis]AFH43135.1 2-5 oligoadenylate synthetase, ubiquitin domain protein region [Fervidicoccus fontis Kam940]MBE9390514.1 CCA tRNA nucleotidyltransferase [Fervidicoccus fontis]PMB75857.1 MAG: CCA tRNA nucleotidyltransferase [Fervidicoccus fontis]PMB77736.1 MAG: CCA tRNA nucleotidyltransferase [Fervidicoccus fontis]HEW64278.1 CCA tRNA nucleotidyltransferase [Fervidicoccus fontis]
MTLSSIEVEILKKIKPTDEDRAKANAIFNIVKNKIIEGLKASNEKFEVLLEGSIAKDTWLRTSPEMDVFIVFENELDKKDFESIVNKLASILNEYEPAKQYAEHPYLTIKVDEYNVDIVPAIKYEKGKRTKTAVDRTPLHTLFILENTTPELRDEIRVAKKFARSIGVYGAETKIEGFSGYLIELLTIKYGGFRELLNKASEWRIPIKISFSSSESIKRLLSKYENCPMIVEDPTDSERNVAAAVSKRKIFEFSSASKLYLKKPTLYFFEEDNDEKVISTINFESLEPYYKNVVIIEFEIRKEISKDVIWGELKRMSKNAFNILKNEGFDVVKCEPWSDEKKEAYIACLLTSIFLPSKNVSIGPPMFFKEHFFAFINEHILRPVEGPWIGDDGRLWSLNERKFLNALQLLLERKKEIAISDFADSLVDMYILSWRTEKLSGKRGVWLKTFIMNKPKWIMPYYLSIFEEKISSLKSSKYSDTIKGA